MVDARRPDEAHFTRLLSDVGIQNMNKKSHSKLTTRTTQSLLSESGCLFCGVFGFLTLMGVGGAFQQSDSLPSALRTMGALLFILYFSLRFFRILGELKRRNENDSNQSSEPT